MVLRYIQASRAALLTGSVALGIAGLSTGLAQSAIAAEPPAPTTADPAGATISPLQDIKSYAQLGQPKAQKGALEQVTSVSQLSDVQPTDWAFQALQSLVERYGCIAGYPNRTYRGNRPLTRYEFAAGLNACMDRVNELIASATADAVKKEDLAAIKKLQEEFATELATLRGRVDSLEARTKTLEAQQFSTTTKLAGEVIFAVSENFGFNGANNNADETVFQPRVRLNFLSSFTGTDRLRVRLQSSNAIALQSGPSTGTNVGQFTYNVGPTGNNVGIDILDYKFSIGKRVTALVMANAGLHHYYADTINPLLESGAGGTGSLSKFGERNPIYRIGANGAGIGFNLKVNDYLKFDVGYISNTAASPDADNGLFSGNYSALAQAVIQPTKKIKLGFTYVRAYDGANRFTLGGVGTAQATLAGTNSPVETNSFGIQGTWRVAPKLQVNAWGGYTDAQFTRGGSGQIWNYGLSLAFPDVIKKGGLAALVVGAEPYRADIANNNVPVHVEGFYKYPVTDKISITPGVIWVTSPRQNSTDESVLIGTVRTTFTF